MYGQRERKRERDGLLLLYVAQLSSDLTQIDSPAWWSHSNPLTALAGKDCVTLRL
jgi:hypothetical protein